MPCCVLSSSYFNVYHLSSSFSYVTYHIGFFNCFPSAYIYLIWYISSDFFWSPSSIQYFLSSFLVIYSISLLELISPNFNSSISSVNIYWFLLSVLYYLSCWVISFSDVNLSSLSSSISSISSHIVFFKCCSSIFNSGALFISTDFFLVLSSIMIGFF